MTLFEKIIRREIPARVVHEDDEIIAVYDVNPQAPIHVLVIPKTVIPRVGAAGDADAELLGKLLLAAGRVARLLKIEESGFRLVINHGHDGGETVPHLHVHLLGGRELGWPPG